jgi:hypothetical protein
MNKANIGRCYELSFLYQVRNPDWILVHGYITNILPPFQTIDHAWCKKDNIIYDAVQEKSFSIEQNETIFKAQAKKEYIHDEALELWENSNGRVLWHDIQDIDIEKYYDENGNIKKGYDIREKIE